MALHVFHGKHFLLWAVIAHPKQDAAMGDLFGVVVRVMFADPARKQHAEDGGRDIAAVILSVLSSRFRPEHY
jgi:acetylornithine/succinyldiaminopimelate/putrescine aminotransferase